MVPLKEGIGMLKELPVHLFKGSVPEWALKIWLGSLHRIGFLHLRRMAQGLFICTLKLKNANGIL